jgi:membrane protein DedA with SNARE-associated domain
MPIPIFIGLTLAGSLIWNSVFVVAGYQLGENWHRVERYAELFQYLVVAVVVLAVLYFIVRRIRSQRSGTETLA